MKILILLLIPFYSFAQSTDLVTYGDYVYYSVDESAYYQPQGAPFNSVTSEYGELVIKAGKYEFESDHKVWSSHWFPYYETELWEGDSAPLVKYDKYAYQRRIRTSAASFEKEKIYNPRASEWEGLCNAWAMAAITYPEPQRAVRLYGIDFEVGDLKALILKTFEKEMGDKFYGQRNNAEWDSVYADVYPEQFHKFLQIEGFEKKNAFIMDFDAGYQVWNVPVYKAKSIIKEDPENPKRVSVKTYVSYASPFVMDRNMVGIENETKVYSYDLYGKWTSKGFIVEYGYWKDSSRWDHPDYLIPRPNRAPKRESNNSEVDYRLVDEIVKYSL